MPGSDSVCAARGIPDYLHQLGRTPDPDFVGNEQLFVRFKPTETEIKNVISFRKQSCNRAKYCQGGLDDVLFDSKHGGRHQEYTGVAAITVAQLFSVSAGITEIKANTQTTRVYTLHPKHEPEPCNYPHSEIIADCNGQPDPDNIKPNSMKKQLRDQLAELYRIVLPLGRAGERLQGE